MVFSCYFSVWRHRQDTLRGAKRTHHLIRILRLLSSNPRQDSKKHCHWRSQQNRVPLPSGIWYKILPSYNDPGSLCTRGTCEYQITRNQFFDIVTVMIKIYQLLWYIIICVDSYFLNWVLWLPISKNWHFLICFWTNPEKIKIITSLYSRHW